MLAVSSPLTKLRSSRSALVACASLRRAPRSGSGVICLSGSKTGFAFRRQLVIGPFVVDFACTKLRLIIELDGSSHEHRERHDAHRDRALLQLGWTILRIEEHLVVQDLDAVVREIVSFAESLRS